MADSGESTPGFRDAARAQILDAAAVVFQAQGFERTTIDDIAERIVATKGRIYYISAPSSTSTSLSTKRG